MTTPERPQRQEPDLAYDELNLAAPKSERYAELLVRVAALLEGEDDWLANLGNVAAEVFAWLPGVNWAGFYLMRGGELVLGPFQGRPACVRIAVGRGVCGAAVSTGTTQLVHDVDEFPGHIACDVRSRSELVAPVVLGGEVVAVLDLDSAQVGNFDEDDQLGIETLVAELIPRIDWQRACQS